MVKKKRMKGMSVLLSVMVVATTLSGCYLLPKEEEPLVPPLLKPAEVSFKTLEVTKGDIYSKKVMSGSFRSVYEVTVTFEKRGGYVQSIYVQKGQEINEGDPIMDLDIDQLQHAADQAYYSYKKARLRRDHLKSIGASSYDIEMADIDKKIAYSAYESAKEELEKAKMYAPISGIITYMADVKIGEPVSARKTICKIADPGQLYLMVERDDAVVFKYGDEVSVEINGIRNKEFTGVVIQAPYDKPQDIVVDSDKPTAFISVEGLTAEQVKIGQGATVTLITERREDVIVLQRRLVKNYLGRHFVNVLEDGIKVERDVELGMTTSTQAEIKEGLEVGDLVIVN